MIYANRPILLDIAAFCRDRLQIPIDININIHECCLKEDSVMGWCYDDYDEEHGYDIELEVTLDPVDAAETLCHEMVHIKQFSEGKDADEEEAEKLETILYKEWREYDEKIITYGYVGC